MKIKKYLPFIIIIVAAFLFVGGIFVIHLINQPVATDNGQSDASVPDLPQNERPVTALIPSSDGHYLSLKLNGINVPGATSLDYVVSYKANNAGKIVPEGFSGTIQINGQTNITRDNILLGSESSGKIRFDNNVQDGNIILRFRDTTGKLLGKLSTDFHLQNGTTALTSVDGSFKYTLTNAASQVWFVTMQSFGTPDPKNVVVFSNGWAVYASDQLPHAGTVG